MYLEDEDLFVAKRSTNPSGDDAAMNLVGIEYEIRSTRISGVLSEGGGNASFSHSDSDDGQPAAKMPRGMSILDKGLARQRSKRGALYIYSDPLYVFLL